jgi:hypothetical protein
MLSREEGGVQSDFFIGVFHQIARELFHFVIKQLFGTIARVKDEVTG